jgi:hypothetical protein
MKFRRFIYIAAIILITFVINKHITYSFEVQEKARTRATVHIGEGEGSYSLPETAGNPGEVLWVNDSGELSWKSIFPTPPELAFSEPFLITEADCANRLGDNKFLPLNPYYIPTRGYCLATLDGTWEGILKHQDATGVKEGLVARDLGRYCEVYHEQSYDLPMDFVVYLQCATTSRLPESRYWNKFTESERQAILDFIDVVQSKPIYYKQLNYYDSGVFDVSAFIVGGFRLTGEETTPLPYQEHIMVPFSDVPRYDSDANITISQPAYGCRVPPEWTGYGDIWDHRLYFDSVIVTKATPFCNDVSTCFKPEDYVYSSMYAICVR